VIPILWNHDTRSIIGAAEWRNGCLRIKIHDVQKFTKEMLFETFGNCGLRVLQYRQSGEVQYIEEFEIYEWSL